MKKHIIPAVCLFSVAALFCCSKPDNNGGDTPVPAPTPDPNPEIIDHVHIPDINFKTYLLENFDIDKDGGISASEAGKVTAIDCKSKGISSLSGIRCFTELTTLDCSGNNLTELVLTENPSKANVPEGNCSKLTSIDCSNNKITALGITGCNALKSLNCSGNRLTNLDVSNNQNLSSLDCSANESLTEVKVSEGQTIENVKKDEGNCTIKVISIPNLENPVSGGEWEW